ncbi:MULTISPECIES: SWIM zinc finger family protein [unclassified Lysinibacillus]|uniref:SWIM zinc finger family protein n=1 Tax=unclassified Lysinibacillus TaxID=2636778 RepID=UPI0025529D24|nr:MULTISPECIES: SWIM zinc finger family protein [unclassified Lysinibacillus]MDM5250901.1 SWIM zinc finger family protein [Lysinibacillus sp. G4S2]
MNINSFEKQFNKVIVQRGHNYYMDGHVIDIIQIDDSNWQAEVEGSELYIVDIVVKANGDITHAECDCPYDDICKHIAAALYEIQGQLNNPRVSVSKSSKAQKPTLQQLLATQSKENLITLILKVGQNSPSFLQELEMLLTEPKDILKAAEQLIIHHLKKGEDRGFIPRNQATKALKGVYTTLQHAQEHFDQGDYITAIKLSFLCFKHTFDALQYSDDSNGYFGGAIEDSLELISQSINEGGDVWSKEQSAMIYDLVIQEAMDHELNGWSDWRIHLLHSCVPLCNDDAIEKQFKTLIHSMKSPSDDWSAQYMNKRLREIELHLLEVKYSSKDIEAFLERHIEDYDMRELMIKSAINLGDYEKVLQLTADGLQVDEKSAGIVKKWRNFAFIAHKALGHTEDMRELALQLVLSGEYSYYAEFKALHPAEQWPEVFEELLDRLKNSHLYTHIIVEEKQTKRILDYCKEHPIRIEYYYKYIKEQYYEEVCALFIDAITADAQMSSNRKSYQDVCHSINIMRKAGYTIEAKQLISDLLQAYPKRRAFMEELKNIQK